MGTWQVCLQHILIYTEGKQGPWGGMSHQVHRRNRIEPRPGSLMPKLLADDAIGYFSRCYNQMPNRKQLEGRKSYFCSVYEERVHHGGAGKAACSQIWEQR